MFAMSEYGVGRRLSIQLWEIHLLRQIYDDRSMLPGNQIALKPAITMYCKKHSLLVSISS